MIHSPGINLARRPFRNNAMLFSVFGLCALLLLAGSLYNFWEFQRTGVELESLRAEIALIDEKHQALSSEVEKVRQEVRTVDLAGFNVKADFANGLLLSKFFSWSELFDLLEEILPPEVKLRSIRPSVSARSIEIQVDGLAQTPMALYEFQKALDEDEHFANVYPLSENTRETRGELNFDLVMDYLPGGDEEDTPAPADQPAQAASTPAPDQPVAPAASGAGSAQAAADPNASGEEEDDGWDDWDEEETGVPEEAAPAAGRGGPQQPRPSDPNGGGR